jgi:hypothetical protein
MEVGVTLTDTSANEPTKIGTATVSFAGIRSLAELVVAEVWNVPTKKSTVRRSVTRRLVPPGKSPSWHVTEPGGFWEHVPPSALAE